MAVYTHVGVLIRLLEERSSASVNDFIADNMYCLLCVCAGKRRNDKVYTIYKIFMYKILFFIEYNWYTPSARASEKSILTVG